MKLIKLIKNYFRSKAIRTSVEQLTLDFGEYPPLPLMCSVKLPTFTIIKTRSIGHYIDRAVLLRRLCRPSEMSHEEFRELLEVPELSPSLQGTAEAKKSLYDLQNGYPALARYIRWLMAIFTSMPVMWLFAFWVERGNRILGYHMPVGLPGSSIVIHVGRIKTPQQVDAVTTHEHLHLLQPWSGMQRSKQINNLYSLIKFDPKFDAFTRYLFERSEVEARLHEVVLSYYRMSRKLPLTTGEFFEMLSSSNQLGWLVKEALLERGIETPEIPTLFKERSLEFAQQLEVILIKINNLDMLYRFISEVLTVMYGNLLKYYGDSVSSEVFLHLIERPNLYDALYLIADTEPVADRFAVA